MLNFNLRLLLGVGFLSLASFSLSLARADSPTELTSEPVLVFDVTVPKSQSGVLQKDLLLLKQLSFLDEDLSGAQLFGREMTATNLSLWLKERSHFVVP